MYEDDFYRKLVDIEMRAEAIYGRLNNDNHAHLVNELRAIKGKLDQAATVQYWIGLALAVIVIKVW